MIGMRENLFRVALLTVLTVCPLAVAEADGVKVYSNGDGVEVVVAQLREPNKLLVQVTGTRSSMDGLVLPFALDSTGQFYSTTWRGQSYTFLEKEKSYGTSTGSLGLYTTNDMRSSQRVHYDEKRSQAVKAADLIARHQAQMKDGSITRFGRFDRKAEQAEHDQAIKEAALSFNKACGTQVPASIGWSGIGDDLIKEISVESFCRAPLSAMERLCEWSEARSLLRAKVKKVICQFGDTLKMDLDAGGTLVWTASKNASNLDEFAQKQLEELQDSTAAGKSSAAPDKDAPPWGQGRTLRERVLIERTDLCTDGKSVYVVLSPDERNIYRMYYGNAKKLNRVARGGGGRFFDPRFVNPNADPNERDPEMRFYSAVQADKAKGTCTVACGTRRSELKLLDIKARTEILRSTSLAPPLVDRTPHALARDEQGNYYYVDRGTTPETEKDFRLFTGPRGSLKPRPIANVASDSQGDIFSTKGGQLRFIAGRAGQESSWIQGKKITKLIAVPVEENYPLIYSDLGVYPAKRLGTPCDDLAAALAAPGRKN
jgi:hypothetical protein